MGVFHPNGTPPATMPRPAARCANCAELTAETHLDWARGVASRVARTFRLRGQERDDVVSAALLKLLELLGRGPSSGGFDPSLVPPGGDPVGAFRGWAYLSVLNESRREAERLRNGGTYRTKRPGRLVVADPLGDAVESIDDAHAADDPRDASPAALDDAPPPAAPCGRALASVTVRYRRCAGS